MEFLFSLVASVAVFSVGVAATSLIFFLVERILKKKIASYKITIFILSLSFLVASCTCAILFFKIEYISKTILNLNFSEIIYFSVVFFFAILFFLFTKISAFIIFPIYLIFSLSTFFVLKNSFPVRDFFQVKANNQNELVCKINCYKLNPMLILPIPQFWYDIDSTDFYNSSNFFSNNENFNIKNEFLNKLIFNFKKFLLLKSDDLVINLPRSSFFPAIYKVNINSTLPKPFLLAEPIL